MTKVDARGFACPEPVLKTKKAMDSTTEEIQVLVDNNTAVENIKRLVSNSSRTADVTTVEDYFIITIK